VTFGARGMARGIARGMARGMAAVWPTARDPWYSPRRGTRGIARGKEPWYSL
jgi:hypothetical protein